MSLSWIDIAFLVTVALLVLNGLKNGALFSLVHLLALPIAFAVAYFVGPQFTLTLASSGFAVTPILAYAILFFGTILILHVLGSLLRGALKRVPVISQGDSLLGGLLGFVEAWLIWLILLSLLGTFMKNAQEAIQLGQTVFQGINIQGIKIEDLKAWHDAYNQAVTTSLFARVNGFFITVLPAIQTPKPLK